MAANTVGFIGLGNMGAPMCANLLAVGFDVVGFDAAGTPARAPEGARVAGGIADLVTDVETVFLSLPDGRIVREVCESILAVRGRATSRVVDFSTTGPEAAREIGAMLGEAGMSFVDAPVSGGRSGAVAGSLTVIVSGADDAVSGLDGAFEAVGGNVFRVGTAPGQAQAMKLLNNFLSATAMAATSEAALFGEAFGLDLSTIVDVVNVSSGRNTASADKFPNRIVTGTYDAGFATALMTKDVALYLEQVRVAGTADRVGSAVSSLWRETDAARPGSDFTEIYRHLADKD